MKCDIDINIGGTVEVDYEVTIKKIYRGFWPFISPAVLVEVIGPDGIKSERWASEETLIRLVYNFNINPLR